MTERSEVENKEIICSVEYDKDAPFYKRIEEEFTNKLKEKYDCEDYNTVITYIFDLVFKKKLLREEIIKKLNNIFKKNPEYIYDCLWKITLETEKEFEKAKDDRTNYNNFKKGGKFMKNKFRNNYDNRAKPLKGNRRERSRSLSNEGRGKKYEYQNYPVPQKGFYPPKGRYGGPMYPYYPPQILPPYMR